MTTKRFIDDVATQSWDIKGRGADYTMAARIVEADGGKSTVKIDMGSNFFLPPATDDEASSYLRLTAYGNPKWGREKVIFSGQVPDPGYFLINDSLDNYHEIAIITFGSSLGSESFSTGWHPLEFFLNDYNTANTPRLVWRARGWSGALQPHKPGETAKVNHLYCNNRNHEVSNINILVR